MTNFKKKSQSDIKAVVDYVKEYKETNNEDCIDLIAYHSQQAIEKLLKHVLHTLHGYDENAITFKTHNVSKIIAMIEENTHYVVPERIADNCDVITSWESSSRYSEETVYDSDKMDYYTSFIFELKDSVENYEKTFQEEKDKQKLEIDKKYVDIDNLNNIEKEALNYISEAQHEANMAEGYQKVNKFPEEERNETPQEEDVEIGDDPLDLDHDER